MNDLVKRTVSGVVFLVVMVAGMLFHPIGFGVLFLLVMYFAMSEFMHVTMGTSWLFQQKMAILASSVAFCVIMGHCCYGLPLKWLCLAMLPFSLIPLSVVFAPKHDDVEMVALAYMSVLYVGVPFCLTPFMVMSEPGVFRGWLLLNVFIIIWCSDVGAYSLGTLLGQKPSSRKLAPAISPKKSFWGLWGGILTAVIGAWILYLAGWMPYPLVHCLAIGLLIPLAGVCGDLFESVWKRRYGYKDSGNLIPGHGGMLDRFDSSLFAIPVVFVYMYIFCLL